MILWLILLLPAALGLVSIPFRRAGWVHRTPALAGLALLVLAIVAAVQVYPDRPLTAAQGVLRLDALSAYLLVVVGAVAVTATLGATLNRPDGWFSALTCLFLTAMSLALLADNLGVLWAAVEGTTIATALLVGYSGSRHALEAAWKYVVLGSVGVAIAFLGIVLVYAATADVVPELTWSNLVAAPAVSTATAQIGLALMALGFATKAGLAPMHSWLPDAYSEAPAQISGLMSGVLSAVAFYAILRVKAISDALLGPDLMRNLLTVTGLLSLAVAALLILTQRNYKRMLAYSSIEHMGILALGAAIGGPLAMAAVLLHILGHGLAKASMFLVAGRILTVTGTARLDQVHSLLSRHPRVAVPWLAGSAALLGFPPFSLFLTEVAIIVAGFQRGMLWQTATALVLLLLVFAGFTRHTLTMTLTRHDSTADAIAAPAQPVDSAADPATRGNRAVVGIALGVVGLLTLGAVPLQQVLTAAAATLEVIR